MPRGGILRADIVGRATSSAEALLSMFQLRPAQGDTWQILNARDEKVFTGSLRQCEDWLDQQENLTPQRRPFFQVAAGIRHLLSRLSVRSVRSVPAEQCEFPPQPKYR